MTTSDEKRLTPEEFVLKALDVIPDEGKTGFHTVWSGFNKAFRKVYPDQDVVALTTRMAEEGKIHIRPTKGGAWLSKPNGKPFVHEDAKVDALLKKIGVGSM